MALARMPMTTHTITISVSVNPRRERVRRRTSVPMRRFAFFVSVTAPRAHGQSERSGLDRADVLERRVERPHHRPAERGRTRLLGAEDDAGELALAGHARQLT